MRFLTLSLAALFCFVGCAFAASTADAAKYRTVRTSKSLPRPVTGYGANFHRNFVIRQELQRAKRGLPVRNTGNILWARR